MTATDKVYDVIVIGAGIHGLSAAYHLNRLGCRRVAVVERWEPGHRHGSSHGRVRITRSTYVSPEYVRLMQVAHHEEWPRLERDSGCKLIHPSSGCFFGPPGSMFEKYASAVCNAGAPVERVDATEGRKRFPWFRFDNVAGVLSDPTAGVVLADDTLQALVRLLAASGVELLSNTDVKRVEIDADPLRIQTDRGTLHTERMVITAGAWVGNLLPELSPALEIARQTVGYFEIESLPDASVDQFPPWVYLEDGINNVRYGLPQLGEGTLKIGRHLTAARDDDPNALDLTIDAEATDDLRVFLDQHLAVKVKRLIKAEHCLYTNTKTEDFLLDLHPRNARIAIGSACSGHGFKFGPLVGRILAELLLREKTSVPEFEQMRGQMSFHSTAART